MPDFKHNTGRVENVKGILDGHKMYQYIYHIYEQTGTPVVHRRPCVREEAGGE